MPPLLCPITTGAAKPRAASHCAAPLVVVDLLGRSLVGVALGGPRARTEDVVAVPVIGQGCQPNPVQVLGQES